MIRRSLLAASILSSMSAIANTEIRVCPHLALHQINIQAIRIIDL